VNRVARTSLVAVVMLCGASLAAQKKPDFSGRWVSVGPAKGPGTEQVVTQDDKSLTTQRPDGTRKTVYQLDGVERRMPPPSSGGMAAEITFMGSAKWDGDRLVVLTTITHGSNGKQQLRDVWSLDKQGQLVIETTEIGPDGRSETKRTIWKKK